MSVLGAEHTEASTRLARTPQALLKCEGLEKSFAGKRVVKSVSFEIYPGECLGVIGPNGAAQTKASSPPLVDRCPVTPS